MEIFHKWLFYLVAVGVPFKNVKLVLVYTWDFVCRTLGHLIILTISYRPLSTVGALPSLCRFGSHNLGAVGHQAVEVIFGPACSAC